MLFQLMNKDKVVATYEEEKRLDDYRYTEIERLDGYVPYGFVDINDWIDGRQIAKHRTHPIVAGDVAHAIPEAIADVIA